MGGLVDVLDRLASEELVTPGQMEIPILHYDCLLVRSNPTAGDPVGLERMVAPVGDRASNLLLLRVGDVRVLERLEYLLDGLGFPEIPKRLEEPVAVRDGVRIVGRGVEDVAEPTHRLAVPLVLHEPSGDEKRDVEEQLPIVLGIGT